MLLNWGADVLAKTGKQTKTALQVAEALKKLPMTVAALQRGVAEPERFFKLLKEAKGSSWLSEAKEILLISLMVRNGTVIHTHCSSTWWWRRWRRR